ncbi:MAG TPA: trehalase family glycosidase, partial [Blastocatellia bacterium]|nr:trehalase family glycosidase [Blastocatellia bacterium]
PVLESLDRAEKKYEGERALSGGSLGDGLEAISRTISWNRFYNPDKQLEFAEIHRSSGRRAGPESEPDRQPRGPVLSWDTFWTASLAAMIDPGVAASTVQVLLDGQTPDGRLPLRRSLYHRPRQEPATLAGRSMPPIGSFCVWKIYLATSDLSLLAAAYPRLLMWNEWWTKDRGDGKLWRDGDGDGLLEWGFDPELEQGALGAQAIPASAKRKLAISESGLEDRLQWTSGEDFGAAPKPQEDGIKYNNGTHTLEFSPVGLNALYALDTEILSMMARELNLPDDVSRLQQRYERIRFNINEKLWSEADGAYLNRRWDGSFSRRLSLENFYPLLAGLADEDRARRMVRLLSQKFWGGQPLSFIARDDPAFHPQGVGRGAVWSLTNYLFYLGLKRYRFQAEAGEIARKSTVMGRAAWEQTKKLSDYYSSSDGIMIEERELLPRPQVTGMIFWPGIEELIGMDLWSGFSIGSLSATEEARVERIRFLGGTFDAIIGPKRTVVRRQGQVELECEAPVKLRMYRSAEHTLGFVIETKANVQLTVPAVEERKITVSVDDQVLGATSPGAAATFKVPAGTHRVFIVK